MSELKITKGKFLVQKGPKILYIVNDHNVMVCELDFMKTMNFNVALPEQVLFNAQLVQDAFNTANQTGLLPSELAEENKRLKQHVATDNSKVNADLIKENEELKKKMDKLLKTAIQVRQWYENNREEFLGEYTPVCFSILLADINSIRQR